MDAADGEITNVNEQRILKLVKRDGPMSRETISDRLDMPRTTVWDNVRRLVESKRIDIELRKEDARSRGRSKVYYKAGSIPS